MVSLLIKLLLPRLVDVVVELALGFLNSRISDDKSRVSREMYEIAEEEKDRMKEAITKEAKDSGIYKKLKKM